MRVWTLSASSTVRRIAKDPVGSIFFQLVRLDFRGCDDNWSNLLMHVLRHSPVLQTLNFVVLDYGLVYFQATGILSEVSRFVGFSRAECLLFHLKTFEWKEYNGTEDEKEGAIYILKNERRLVTATVFPDSLMLNKCRVFKELEIAMRDSRACELKLG
ncbi:hypothetical protein Bca4012_033112 [Brassica carinata]